MPPSTSRERSSRSKQGLIASAFGSLLRRWREHRGLSQLALALEAQISQRHLSFVETGRSTPSREMIARISQALDLPLRVRNEFLVAAGFAPSYGERGLDQSEMAGVRAVLDRMLNHHEPYPAMVLDRGWNLVMQNAASRRIVSAGLGGVAPDTKTPGRSANFLRLMFAPNGIRRRIINWDQVGPALLSRVRREARAYPGSPSESLFDELSGGVDFELDDHLIRDALPPTIVVELEVEPGVVLRLTNTLTTFGTPQDVGVQELRVEMAYPVDPATDRHLRDWVSTAERSGHSG